MRMRIAAVVGSISVVLFCAAGGAVADESPENLAKAAAESWLALVDAGKYAESWNQAASLFRDQVSSDQWARSVGAARGPLGAVESRAFDTAEYTRTLPGAPDGEYVVLAYKTWFANKKSAVEIVTPTKDKDGKWRVSGYFVR
jgi:hypothetical protein